MKKNVYFLLALLLIGLSACDNAPKFKVQGEINGAEDKMLYLEASGLDGIVALDSAKLGSSGSFSFAQKRPESPEFYRLRLDNKVINFAVDSTETVSVKAEINDFATAYRIEGSENNLKIKELVLLQADLQKNVDKLGQNRNIPAGIAQDSLLAMVNNYKNKVKREYIFAAPNMPYAYFALFQSLNGYMIFDPLTNKEDVKCFAAVKNTAYNEGLWQEIDAFTRQLTSTTQMEDIKHQPVIFATREAYKRCGKDPGRYRPSAEALRRRTYFSKYRT